VDETRGLINRVTGVIATLSALVLGLLIVSANNFYNTQKSGLETASARVLQIDGMLRRSGPEAQQARNVLKNMFASKQTNSGILKMPTIEETNASMVSMIAEADVGLGSWRARMPNTRAAPCSRSERSRSAPIIWLPNLSHGHLHDATEVLVSQLVTVA
jgi:hypothetical protein